MTLHHLGITSAARHPLDGAQLVITLAPVPGERVLPVASHHFAETLHHHRLVLAHRQHLAPFQEDRRSPAQQQLVVDVVRADDGAANTTAVVPRTNAHRQPQARTQRCASTQFHVAQLVARERHREDRIELLPILLHQEIRHGLSVEVGNGPTQLSGHRRRGPLNATVAVHDEDEIIDGLRKGAVSQLGILETDSLLVFLVGAAKTARESLNPTLGVARHPNHEIEPHRGSRGIDQTDLVVQSAPFEQVGVAL